jgi:hypothetical protein
MFALQSRQMPLKDSLSRAKTRALVAASVALTKGTETSNEEGMMITRLKLFSIKGKYSGPKKVDHSGHLYLLTFFALSTLL